MNLRAHNGGRWLSWISTALAVALLACLVFIPALHRPWTWDWQQDFIVLYLICFCAIAAMCAWIWFRRGTHGLKAGYRMLAEQSAKRRSLRSEILSLAIWIAIAVALVIYFNIRGR